jgi:hypothetical protein
MSAFTLNVNGERHLADADSDMPLLWIKVAAILTVVESCRRFEPFVAGYPAARILSEHPRTVASEVTDDRYVRSFGE